LLPINYWSKPSLIRKYHSESLDLKLAKPIHRKKDANIYKNNININKNNNLNKFNNQNCKKTSTTKNRRALDLNLDSFENFLNDRDNKCFDDNDDFEDIYDVDENDDDLQLIKNEFNTKMTKINLKELKLKKNGECEDDYNNDFLEFDEDYNDEEERQDDEDIDELREQLDMHSIILSKSLYEGSEFDEPIITAEQVLDEIDTIINMVKIFNYHFLFAEF
jgi:hypothetical protein